MRDRENVINNIDINEMKQYFLIWRIIDEVKYLRTEVKLNNISHIFPIYCLSQHIIIAFNSLFDYTQVVTNCMIFYCIFLP